MSKQTYIEDINTYTKFEELKKHLREAEKGDYVYFYPPYCSRPRLAVITRVTKAIIEATDGESTRAYTKETARIRGGKNGGCRIIGYIPACHADELRTWLKNYIIMRLEDPDCDPVKMMLARIVWMPNPDMMKYKEHYRDHNPLAGFAEAANASY